MPDVHEIKVRASVEGIGDGEVHTIGTETAERVSELIEDDLRDRYAHLGEGDVIEVMAVEAPNLVTIHVAPAGDEEGEE